VPPPHYTRFFAFVCGGLGVTCKRRSSVPDLILHLLLSTSINSSFRNDLTRHAYAFIRFIRQGQSSSAQTPCPRTEIKKTAPARRYNRFFLRVTPGVAGPLDV
jgi:hypothetical protein